MEDGPVGGVDGRDRHTAVAGVKAEAGALEGWEDRGEHAPDALACPPEDAGCMGDGDEAGR